MRAAQAFCLFVCFIIIDWIRSESRLAPHGPKSVEMVGPRAACMEKKWPICTADHWGAMCPSGCRMQGLIHVQHQQNDERVQGIQQMLENYSKMSGNTHVTVNEAVDRIRQSLNRLGKFGDTYYRLVDQVNSRLTNLQNRINYQIVKLRLLQKSILEQFRSITRLEVDIGIKLQSCKGSCAQSVVYNINNEQNAQMEKSLNSMAGRRLEQIVYNKPVHKLSIVKKANAVTGFKSASDISLKCPKFWEEIDMGLFGLDNDIPDEGSSIFLATDTGSTSKATDVHTDNITSGDVSSTPGGMNSTRRENTLLSHGINSTRNADTPLTHTEAETSNVALNMTKYSIKGTFSESSHDARIYPSTSGSQSVVKQNFSKNANFETGYTFTEPLLSLEQIGQEAITLPQDRKGFPDNSTFTDTGSSEEFSDYSDLRNVDDSYVINSNEPVIPSTKEVTEFKDHALNIESHNSFFQYAEDSNTMHPSINGSLFSNDEITDYVPGEHIHNLSMEKVHKIKNYIGKDCNDIMQKHAEGGEDGLFKIMPSGCVDAITVYCDQSTGVGGWMLVQQRMDETVNFNQSWDKYKRGFGRLDDEGRGNIWLGNDVLHLLTAKETSLRIELEDWSGNRTYAEYIVNVGSESENYTLNITSYTGNAGDALISGLFMDTAYTSHANMKFSTFDRDNDNWEENCAQFYGGGWWYNNCQAANLNGIYYHGGPYDPRDNVPYEIENGVIWDPFKGIDYSLKVVKMKIRPITSV
ncbi:fibrinogen alpha chain-like isoform X2 [Amblyraja radiata]|uniref:fibrinogen alpha chain-like isoform X2 n=1 Tax=Amblyraja radiata TaxID=386614 RepID=UPI001401FB0F|nr:fibrinogen alpha chain-like isoform X2 [Amblyraja radiata]